MDKRLSKKTKLKIIIGIIIFIVCILAAALFILLVKVKGNFSYVYNYLVKTEGSIEAEYYPEAEAGANLTTAYFTDATNPSDYFRSTALQVDGVSVDNYIRSNKINFTQEFLDAFTSWKGLITYRGNYSRNLQSFGTVHLTEQKFNTDYWSVSTGKVLKSDGVNYWSGNGWTGQPLVVEWDDDVRQHMNMYDWAKEKDGLVEVIYPGMDGQIHFLDMETGEATRDCIYVGLTFKGTCSLHPDMPLLVCGAGDSQPGMYGEFVCARVFIYNLFTGEKLYELGADDDFAPRTWHAYDSSAVFCPAADTLICPGENGVLYTIHLNSQYNREEGTLSIAPDELVQYTYYASTAEERIYLGEGGYGSEASAAVWGEYLFLGDNGGMFYCLDLNTMSPVWVQDVQEDVNSSPVFEVDENGNKYVYVATTLKYHTDEHHIGEAAIYKLNAMNGEIIWRKPYQVHTVSGLAGGMLATGVLGEGAISNYIIYAVSKCPEVDSGYIVAINKYNGDEAWRIEMSCDIWSSASAIYDEDGSVYLIQCCNSGDILLIDAVRGKILDRMNFGTVIEATPAVYNNRLVVGLRSEKIIGVEFK